MKNLIEKTSRFTQRGAVAMQLNRPKFRKQRGATAIEYAIIAALVAAALLIIFGATGGFQGVLSGVFEKVKEAVGITT